MITYKVFETIGLGPVRLHIWGIFLALAFLAAYFVGAYLAKEKKIKTDHILNLIIIGLISSFIGSRIFYVIENWFDYKNDIWSVFKVWQGGMVFYGGFMAAFVCCYFYVKYKKLNFWKMADIVAIMLSLGLFVGRIGCFMIHDHLGVVMKHNWFWGINMGGGVIRHETALYESLLSLIVFFILWFSRKRSKVDGILFALFLIFYSLIRFFAVDFFRDFVIRYYNLTVSQWISIMIFCLGIWILWLKVKSQKLKI